MKNLSILVFALVISAAGHSAIADFVVRQKVAGIDCLVAKTNVKDVVIVRGAWMAGDACAPSGNPTIPALVAGMLDKGTVHRDKFTLARALEDLGAQIRFTSGDSVNAEFMVSCLREDLPAVIAMLAEQLRSPAFSEEEFAKYKKQISAGIRRQTEDTSAQANRALARSIYPVGHVNRLATFEEWQKGVEAATVADLKAFHAAHYGTAHLTIVATGDVDAAQIHSLLTDNFRGWGGEGAAAPLGQPAGSTSDGPKEQTVLVPGKTSVSVVWGQASGVRYTDTDSMPLRLGTAILGDGFTSRLTKQLREKEGLTYSVSAGLRNDTFSDGGWVVSGSFAPALLEKGVASMRKAVAEFLTNGITEAELAAQKTNFIGSQQVSLATTSGLTTALLRTVQRGLPVGYLDEYPAKVDAITTDQVNDAIRRRIRTDDLILVKAGTIQP